jgi:GTP pyrophosphokinase
MNKMEVLTQMVLAPWIMRATELIGKPRNVGGNAFRHQIATMGILIDYGLIDSIMLKASLIHDLIEDCPDVNQHELRQVDQDGNEVVDLVLAVTKRADETKPQFLSRILHNESPKARILKIADRISNITDLHIDQYTKKKMRTYLEDTEKFILPMAKKENEDMFRELSDLVSIRKTQMNYFKLPFQN